MSSNKIFISAGELSGDVHGGNLIKEIKKLEPNISISAIGGDNMARYGAKLLYHIRDTAFMGFVEVIKHLSVIKNIWRHTLIFIDKEKPDLIILIDYPGFNLRLAKSAYKRRVPAIYFISPQVWAWHQSRVEKIKKYTKEVLCILPFEEGWYKERGVNATFIGHPLLDSHINKKREISEHLQNILNRASNLIGLFPGSRKQEVERHLPVMIKSVDFLRKDDPKMLAVVAIAPEINIERYKERFPYKWLHWIKDENDGIMQYSDLLIVSSGTASLEAAIHQTPMVVIYKLSPLSYWLGRRIIKVPYIAAANLIAGRQGITELIQHHATPKNIAKEANKILESQDLQKEMKSFFKEVKKKLGQPGASKRAARIIVDYIRKANI